MSFVHEPLVIDGGDFQILAYGFRYHQPAPVAVHLASHVHAIINYYRYYGRG